MSGPRRQWIIKALDMEVVAWPDRIVSLQHKGGFGRLMRPHTARRLARALLACADAARDLRHRRAARAEGGDDGR